MSDTKPLPAQPVPTSKDYKPAHGGYPGTVAPDAKQAPDQRRAERLQLFCYRYGASAKKLGAL